MAKMKLQKRERTVVAAGVVVVVLILVQALWTRGAPLQRYRDSARQVNAARQRLTDVQDWHDAVVAARRSGEELERAVRARGSFDLFSFVKRAVDREKLTPRSQIESQQTAGASSGLAAVKLRLTGVSMEELVKLLHAIYSDNSLVVLQTLDELRPADDQKGLFCSMTFVAPRG